MKKKFSQFFQLFWIYSNTYNK